MRHRGHLGDTPLPNWLMAVRADLGAEVITTHISWLVLTADRVYKVKQPVKFPFLDYSTPAKRWTCCLDEVRLNQRYAPEVYLGVVSLGPQQEPAVLMRRFPESDRLDHVCARGELTFAQMTDLAEVINTHYQGAAVASIDAPFGSPEQVANQAQETARELATAIAHITPDGTWSEGHDGLLERIAGISAALAEMSATCAAAFRTRAQHGCVRECHGDLHLGNLVCLDGRVTPFDCIEFNPEYRWLDVASEVAFTYIDLLDHQQPALAGWLLTSWLEAGGDYDALTVFRFYCIYRTTVRALVAALQGEVDQVTCYVEAARTLVDPGPATLTITHGFSGSGKTTAAAALVQGDPTGRTIRVRSDVERKRLYGLAPLAASDAEVGTGIYSPDAHTRTYDALWQAAYTGLTNGWSMVIDAAFLQAYDRARFAALADSVGCSFMIVECAAPLAELRRRVQDRTGDASEATPAVLAAQMATAEPLTAHELDSVHPVP